LTTIPRCPLVVELSPPPDAEDLFLRLAGLPHVLFLDSALRDPLLGRYSFLSADPWDYFETSPDDADSLGELARRMAAFQASPLPGLPPFQGGAAGLLAYDLGRQLEKLPAPAVDEFRLPAMAIGLYDVVAAFDHLDGRFWIVSQGFPERQPEARWLRARRRLKQFQDWLAAPAAFDCRRPGHAQLADLRPGDLAPCRQVPGREGLWSNFSESAYLEAVRRAIDYIYAGDVFQVNLAQRLLARAADDSVALYLRLRKRNPAPFAGYFDLGAFQIASASPERFLQVVDRQVETRPIKGTRPRTSRPEADRWAGEELLGNEKERAENVMIVDLLRNDLSRVCRPESVYVSQLCRLESYAFVQHLVSAVRGVLREGCGPIELVRAAFPGGSVTGAPKVRAMEIIAQLEPTARGPYCGSLGYLGFDGSLDLNILIRTITAGCGWWQAPVGGGIVAQSEPRREYEETWHKAEGLLRAMW
jgi:para-aminobenzoate synthetase component 1